MARLAAIRAINNPEASVSMWPASTNSARLLVHQAPITSATRMETVIPNAIASLVRWVPCGAWSWPALIISSVLGGLLVATYVRDPANANDLANRRKGTAGGLLTFFAVGCPVCNKLVLIALGSAGALTWFEPIQPILQAVAVALLGWALFARLEGERFCPLPASAPAPVSARAADDRP